MASGSERTTTSSFGVGRREGHDASGFYSRFNPPALSSDENVDRPPELLKKLGAGHLFHGSSVDMNALPDNSVALVVTSPPYFVGKEYELAVTGESDTDAQIPATYIEFLEMLRDVFSECRRVLEPGGRIAVNVANLGRKPYRSLSADIVTILQDDLSMLLRGEVIWEKSSASSGSCAWGSFAKASNPVLRDVTERIIIASKGRFARAVSLKDRRSRNLPHESTLSNDEFVDVTRDVWKLDAESATRIGHPAPFPVELPRRLIDLYTYKDDIVLDPFAGSGSTIIAAARTGRIGVGYDTDESYVKLAEERLDAELKRVDALQQATLDLHEVAGEGDSAQGFEAESSRAAASEAPSSKATSSKATSSKATSSKAERALAAQKAILNDLSPLDRQEHFQARAVQEGKKTQDIARAALETAGFASIRENVKDPNKVVEFNFQTTDQQRQGRWWVDVAGTFTTNRPGLQRVDTVWKMLGRLMVLSARDDDPPDRVLVLTPSLPKKGSPGDRAIREVGHQHIFDVIELFDPDGLDRLRRYATESNREPLPGFW